MHVKWVWLFAFIVHGFNIVVGIENQLLNYECCADALNPNVSCVHADEHITEAPLNTIVFPIAAHIYTPIFVILYMFSHCCGTTRESMSYVLCSWRVVFPIWYRQDKMIIQTPTPHCTQQMMSHHTYNDRQCHTYTHTNTHTVTVIRSQLTLWLVSFASAEEE